MADQTASRILQSVDPRSRRLVSRLQKLQEIGMRLSEEQDLRTLLDLILRGSRRLTQADAGAIFVREDDVEPVPHATGKDPIQTVTPFLVLKVAQNDSIDFPFREMKLPFDRKTISGHVALSGELLNIEDVYRLPEGVSYSYSKTFDEASGYRCRSMLVIAMRNRAGDVIGVIQLINKSKEGGEAATFDAFDEELALALASQAAVCIEKTRLYDEIEQMFEGLVGSFTLALEQRNKTTYGHCRRVAGYAVAIAEAINEKEDGPLGGVRFTSRELRELRYAALLHDIGKIAVPEAILDKKNKLTDSELEIFEYRLHYARACGGQAEKLGDLIEFVRRINVPRGLSPEDREKLNAIRAERFTDVDGKEKPLLSDYEYENLQVERGNLTPGERKTIEHHIVDTWEVLKRIPWPRDLRWVPNVAACHHEKNDGSGYPWGLKGRDIPFGGQILALVDIFEALTARDRPYKPAIPVDKAIQIVQEEVDQGRLNADLWGIFLERKLYNLYRDTVTGFVARPAAPEAAV